MDLPVYKFVISDETEGIEFVALVPNPAIKVNYQYFSEEKNYKFQVQDEEKRVVSGPLLISDKPIIRKAQGSIKTDFYAVFDKESIWKIVQKFFRNKKESSVNLLHDSQLIVDGVFCFESMIIDKARGINTPTGFDELPDGSWFGSFKVDNDVVWNEVKAGTFKGFSIEGPFAAVKDETPDEKLLNQLMEILEEVN